MFSINNFRLGAITPVDYRLGSVPIQRMYLGQICVFDRTPAEKTVYTFEVKTDMSTIVGENIGNTALLEIYSYKETYVGDTPQGDATRIAFTNELMSQFPDWCVPEVTATSSSKIWSIVLNFTENTSSQARQATVTLTQQESGKQVTFTVKQEAATITTQYTLNVQPIEDTLTGADGDNSTTFAVSTYKQQVINDTVQSAKTHVTCSFDSHNANESAVVFNSTNNNNGTYTGTVTCNMSSTNKDYPITITQSESNKTATFTLHKVDPTVAYGDITITSFTYPKVASAAGETLTPTVTYSQTYGYNGATTGGGTITSGATVTYSGTFVDASTGKIIISSKGTTVSGETTVSEVTVHVSMNGKTASETFTVRQEANTITYGEVTGGTATANDILASGGTVSATATKNATQTISYTSGSTRSGNITTSATEVSAPSLGTTVKDRTQVGTSVLTFTGEGSKTQKVNVAVYQQANAITGTTYKDAQILLEANPMTIPATGGTSNLTTYATRTATHTYTSGATKDVEESAAPYTTISGEGFSLSASSAMNITITAEQNTGPQRTATITSKSYDVTETLTITQESGQTITSYGAITITDGSVSDIPASGGSMTVTGYRATQNVTYSSTETGTIDVTNQCTTTTITGQDLGTTIKERTLLGQAKVNCSANGKTATASFNVYQQANTATYSELSGGAIKADDIPASGGTVSATVTTNATQTASYTSGASGSATVTSSATQVSANNLNTTEKARTKVGTSTVTFTGQGGKTKQLSTDVYQAANVKTAGDITYGNWNVSVSTSPTSVNAASHTNTITRSASRTRTQNYNYTSGAKSTSALSNETATPTLSSNATWCNISGTTATIAANTSTSSRTATITATHASVNDTCTITQTGDAISSYGNITITGGSVNDIPASGGSVTPSGCTATIARNYVSGKTDSTSVPSANISYTSVSNSSLGTTVKGRTKIGTATCTASYQGKSATKNFDVYQQANTRFTDDIDYGAWQVSVSANPTTIAASGGTSTITRSASRTRVQNYSYTSGATSQSSLNNETGTPTLSITGSGFSLNSTTVTASSNVPAKTYALSVTNPSAELEDGPAYNLSSTVTSTYSIAGTNSRNCTVTANMNGTIKTCTITQSGNTASSGNQDWSVAKGTNLNSATKSGSTVVMTPEPQYGNKNETFTGQCTVTQTGSNKTATATGTWYKGYLNVSPTSLQFDANGGTKTVDIDTNLYWEIVPA